MNEKTWNHIAIGAIVAMALVLMVPFVLPKPSMNKLTQTRRNEETKLRNEVDKVRDDVSAFKARNAKRLWILPSDQVGAAAMAKVTQIANEKGLKVLAFRPQRTADDSGVTRLPYQVAIDGSFVQVLDFIRAVETPTLKLPVVSVQLASADGATDRVTATIGIVAYREQETTK